MSAWVIPFAALCVVFLAGIAICLFMLHRSRACVGAVEQRVAADRGELQRQFESLAAQVQELKKEPPIPAPSPQDVRPGFNLSTRSMALRMHRRGDQPREIAAALQVPRQEVELLLKVHRIVMSNI